MKSPATLLLLLLLAPASALADEVLLRGGGSVTGIIVERTESEIKVDVGAGRITVKLTNVERIVTGESDLSEYRRRAAAMHPQDAEGWRRLADWANRKGLRTQATEAYNEVLRIFPQDVQANEALGRVMHEGRWVTQEESWAAQGFVELEGEWMTPQERQYLLDDRAAEEQAEQVAIADQIAYEEQRRADKEAADAEYWDRARDTQLPMGGMVYWDAGVGPVLVPDINGDGQ